MLDAFKNISSGKRVQQQTTELRSLIDTAREERKAVSAMLTALAAGGAKLTPLSKSLEQVGGQAATVTKRLDEIAARVKALDDRTKEVEEVDKRILALKESVRQAEQASQKAIGPDGELQKHREAVQQLSSQALQTHASIETLKKERALLDEMRGQLQETQTEVKQSVSSVGTLK